MSYGRWNNKQHDRETCVVLTCTNEMVSANGLQFENIEEDMEGRDRVTFVCPACNERHKSLVYT